MLKVGVKAAARQPRWPNVDGMISQRRLSVKSSVFSVRGINIVTREYTEQAL